MVPKRWRQLTPRLDTGAVVGPGLERRAGCLGSRGAGLDAGDAGTDRAGRPGGGSRGLAGEDGGAGSQPKPGRVDLFVAGRRFGASRGGERCGLMLAVCLLLSRLFSRVRRIFARKPKSLYGRLMHSSIISQIEATIPMIGASAIVQQVDFTAIPRLSGSDLHAHAQLREQINILRGVINKHRAFTSKVNRINALYLDGLPGSKLELIEERKDQDTHQRILSQIEKLILVLEEHQLRQKPLLKLLPSLQKLVEKTAKTSPAKARMAKDYRIYFSAYQEAEVAFKRLRLSLGIMVAYLEEREDEPAKIALSASQVEDFLADVWA